MSNEPQPGDSQSPSALASPFLYRDFCVFWTGSFLSGIGTQFTTVAMAWQIYELTNSPLELGLLGLARGAPMLALLLTLKDENKPVICPFRRRAPEYRSEL